LAITTTVTALIFLPILLLPNSVTDPREGMAVLDADPPA